MAAEPNYSMPYTQAKYSAASAAAAIVMAANYHSVDADHDTVVKHLKIEENKPAGKENIKAVLNLAGFKFKEFYQEGRSDEKSKPDKDISIDQLLKHIDEKKPIIANLSYGTGEGHYVVVHSHDGSNIIYHDPDKGQNQKLAYADFDKKWASPDGKWKKWYVVVDKPEHIAEHEHEMRQAASGDDRTDHKKKDSKSKTERKKSTSEPESDEMPEFA
jgi:ABC-type bacteriocin/lantibiotic exporter with double-glycine peptidase domain